MGEWAGRGLRDFAGRVAVITGAGSGIGRALAIAAAARGMRLALLDVDMKGLEETRGLLAGQPLIRRCDVSKAEDVQAAADAVFSGLGNVHLLFNNAGVAVGGYSWLTTADDWQWSLGVNLMGVANGIRAFVPRMIAAGDEGRVINTASVAGFLSVPGSSVYCATKHAVVTLSECMRHELAIEDARIGVSVLCPAFAPTGIADAERNRPAELAAKNPSAGMFDARLRKAVESGRLTADDIARIAFEGIEADRFYILTHPKIKAAIATRMEDILEERTPTDTVPR
ncbi:MAG: SDR family NAD(P)-dependent oxidoreductase [Hyphomicrobiales bacterium]|nr:SDR family NAD(P)-dependent oxidoreductase [Hyphomicrobiales bacterium]